MPRWSPSRSLKQNKGSRPPPPSVTSPRVVEFAKCNHDKFWRSVTRGFKRYLTTLSFMPMQEEEEKQYYSESGGKYCFCTEEANPSAVAVADGFSKFQMSPNYYSEMNDEERAEKLTSAIVYCKTPPPSYLLQDNSRRQ